MGTQNLQEVFDLAVKIEQSLGLLYAIASTKISNAKWREFWLQLQREEENHASMIDVQRRLIQRERKIDVKVAIDKENAEKILETVEALKASWQAASFDLFSLKEDKDRDSPSDLIAQAIFIEEMVSAIHTDNIVVVTDEKVKKMFEQLAAQDNQHIEKLRDFADESNFL